MAVVDPENQPLIQAQEPARPSYQGVEVDVEVELTSEVDVSLWERSVQYVNETLSRTIWQKTLGVVLVLCAGFSFTSSNVMQKFAVRQLTFWQLLANR